jgi:hypothetical protein
VKPARELAPGAEAPLPCRSTGVQIDGEAFPASDRLRIVALPRVLRLVVR